MICKNCNQITPDGSSFCVCCGTKIEANSNNIESGKFCNVCNSLVPADSCFCVYCGSKLETGSDDNKQGKRRVVVERAYKLWNSNKLVFQIMCDGNIIATIRNGETKAFEIDETSHMIQCSAVFPNSISGTGFNGTYFVSGGGGTAVSDVVKIPEGTMSAELLVAPDFPSLKLTFLRFF